MRPARGACTMVALGAGANLGQRRLGLLQGCGSLLHFLAPRSLQQQIEACLPLSLSTQRAVAARACLIECGAATYQIALRHVRHALEFVGPGSERAACGLECSARLDDLLRPRSLDQLAQALLRLGNARGCLLEPWLHGGWQREIGRSA